MTTPNSAKNAEEESSHYYYFSSQICVELGKKTQIQRVVAAF